MNDAVRALLVGVSLVCFAGAIVMLALTIWQNGQRRKRKAAMLDLSKVDAVLLSDGWHFINVGSFALVSEGTVGHAPSFTFTMPDREGVGGDSVGGTVVGPWYSVRAWRTPTT